MQVSTNNFLCLLLASLFFISNCVSADKEASADTKSNSVNQVSIIKYKFEPQILTIKVGQSVNWTNKEKRQYHSVWFDENGDPESDYLFPDDSYQKTFSKKGTFNYKCGPHPEMIGVIIVE